MLFNQVTEDHILQAIQDFEEKGYPNGFGPSSTYDVLSNNKTYPPKAIMAYANFHAEGRTIERYFKGGLDTDCFNAFKRNGFEVVTKNKPSMHNELYALKQEFLNSWPIEKLEIMTLDEYTNLDKEDSFCYWVEQKTKSLGDVRGGSSYKFGIYKMADTSKTEKANNRDNNGDYAWHNKYGDSQQEAFGTIKSTIIKIAKSAQNNNLEDIDIIDLGNSYKWKIAFLYSNFNVLNIFKLDALNFIATSLDLDFSDKTSVSGFSKKILKSKPKDKDYFIWSNYLWNQYEESLKSTQYWLYCPGKNAEYWDEFFDKSIMALGWDKIGEISQYNSKDEIRKALKSPFNGIANKSDYVNANYDFANTMQVGDIVIVKEGRDKLLGHGVVTSDYFFDEQRALFKSCRKVNWESKGEWNTSLSLGLKTLKNITKDESEYNNDNKLYEYLMRIMNTKNTDKLVDEYIIYLEELGYAALTVDIYSNNFDYCLNSYIKKYDVNVLKTKHYKTLSETSLETYIENTHPIHEGKGWSNFTSFFEKKLKLIERLIPSKNRILYGPPGTGKTFYLKDQLFDKYTTKQTSITNEQNFEKVISGCSWWQVIAIALLDIGTSKVSDIFDHEWVQKKASLSSSKTIRPTLWGQLQCHTINECEYVNVTNRQTPLIFNKTEDSYWEILEDQVEELVPELYNLKDSVENYNPDPDIIIKNYDFVTFHQSFAYEDFIEGIKPISPEEGEESSDLGYRIENGVFKELCIRAKNDPDNRYAIFIDEINRGNVSAIFGELITLIETDKRQGSKNEMTIKLPYSKTDFSVPSNLDIYGTMNTADRSVEALDTALRRRFEFKEMMPNYNVLEEEVVKGVELKTLLQTINERIEILIDRDHTIGHSYFVGVDTEQKLVNAFNNKIVPLLQEYFYGDYGKIGLVLGNGFVDKIKNDKIDFASFDYENANDFKTPSYILKKVDANNVMDAVASLYGINVEQKR